MLSPIHGYHAGMLHGSALALLWVSLSTMAQEPSAADWVAKLGGAEAIEAEAALVALKKEAIPALKEGFARGEIPVQLGILRVAGQLGSQAAELAPVLADAFRNLRLDETLGWRIAPAIALLGSGRKKAAATWADLISDPQIPVDARGFAILGVAALEEDGSPAIESMLGVLAERPVSILQPLAAHALGRMPKTSVRALAKRLSKVENIEFTWHVLALVHCGEHAKAAAKVLPPYALTDDWKQHGFVQRALQLSASARAVEASRAAEVEREGRLRKGAPMPLIYLEEPSQFRGMLGSLDPKFENPDFAMDFPERLPIRIIGRDFAVGDIEEGLGQHLLDSLVLFSTELRETEVWTWSGIHRRLDGLTGLAEGLAVFSDHSPGRTQPKKD